MNVIIQTSFVILLFCGFSFAQDQNGRSTRYWDCCKPSCGWNGKADFTHPVYACAADGTSNLQDFNVQSGCDGGTAFSCANNQPWAADGNLAYGFAAASIAGEGESQTCCACYELTFTSAPVTGQRMVVQVTNSGGDLGTNQFDLQIPGGGVGLFNGCTPQYGAPPDGWGQRYGGVSSRDECSQLPGQLQSGCQWRFDWFKQADNPEFTFHRVACPAVLTNISGCKRSDE